MRDPFDEIDKKFSVNKPTTVLPEFDAIDAQFDSKKLAAATAADDDDPFDLVDISVESDPVTLRRLREEKPWVPLSDSQHRAIWEAERKKSVRDKAGELAEGLGQAVVDTGSGMLKGAYEFLTEGSVIKPAVDVARGEKTIEEAAKGIADTWQSYGSGAIRGVEDLSNMAVSMWNDGSGIGDVAAEAVGINTPEDSFENYLSRMRNRELIEQERRATPSGGARAASRLAEAAGLKELSTEIRNDDFVPTPNVELLGELSSPIAPEGAVFMGAGKIARATGLSETLAKASGAAGRTAAKGVEKVAGTVAGVAEKADDVLKRASQIARDNPIASGAAAAVTALNMNPLTAAQTIGAVGAVKATPKVARVVEDIARAASEKRGRAGIFEAAAKSPKAQEATKRIFGGLRGRMLDTATRSSAILFGRGAQGAVLAPLLGVGEIEDARELGQAMGTGISAAGFDSIADFKGELDMHRRLAEDADVETTFSRMNPQSAETAKRLISYDTVLSSHRAAQQRAAAELAEAEVRMQQEVEDSYNERFKPSAEQTTSSRTSAISEEVANKRVALDKANRELANVESLDPQQRAEYERQAALSVADVMSLADGLVPEGASNIDVQILPEAEIVALIKERNPTLPDEIVKAAAQSAGFATDSSGTRFVIDPSRPSVVINADRVAARLASGEKIPRVIMHEAFHALEQFPGVKESLDNLNQILFGVNVTDITTGEIQAVRPGLYTQQDLVRMFNDEYYKGFSDQYKRQTHPDLYQNGVQDPEKVAEYMRREVRAEYAAGTPQNNGSLVSSLRSPLQAARDWAAIAQSNTMLGKARDTLRKFGVDVDTDPNTGESKLLGVNLDPVALSAVRQAFRQIERLNGDLGVASGYAKDPSPISELDIMNDLRLQERYGNQLFDTQTTVLITAPDGKVTRRVLRGSDAVTDEGVWVSQGGRLVRAEGAGEAPKNIVAPEGATVAVSVGIARNPDGTPIRLSTRELERRAKKRNELIFQAIDSAPDTGASNRARNVGNDTYRGVLDAAQLDAIDALPDSIVAPSLKARIRQLNEILQRRDGTRVMMEYQAALKGGKYRSLAPKFRDEVPIGFQISKAGNFLVTTMSVSRMFDKLNAWRARMPERLAPWGGDPERFWDDFRIYLANHANGRPGETGLSSNASTATQKKNILNDFFDIATKETLGMNPDRTKVGTGKTRRKRDDDLNRIITSRRIDRITDMVESNAEKLPIDYGKISVNFSPVVEDPSIYTSSPLAPADAISETQARLNERKAKLPEYTTNIVETDDGEGWAILVHASGTKQPIGRAIVYPGERANSLDVADTIVQEKFRGKGYGEALYREIAKFAQKKKYSEIYGSSVSEDANRVRSKLFTEKPIDGQRWKEEGWNRADRVPRGVQYEPNQDFYSQLENVIETKMPRSAAVAQIKGIIDPTKGSGVKAEELKWSGINQWLEGRDKVTKDEVLEYLRNEGSVQFKEVNLGTRQNSDRAEEQLIDFTRDAIEAHGDIVNWPAEIRDEYNRLHENVEISIEQEVSTQQGNANFSQYVLPGGENYREVVLAMPKFSFAKTMKEVANRIFGVDHVPDNSTPEQDATFDLEVKRLRDSARRAEYKSRHFPNVPNYVAHMRLNDRVDADGKPGLFIEEIQSDRHQAGREKGYSSDGPVLKPEFSIRQIKPNDSRHNLPDVAKVNDFALFENDVPVWLIDDATSIADAAQKFEKLAEENDQADAYFAKGGGIPDAPFRKDWPLQMFKRALRDAVASGKEWIGWTSGDTQAERYDLSKQVESVGFTRKSDGTYNVFAKLKGRSGSLDQLGNYPADKLPEVVGKELAQKMVEHPDDKYVFKGVDLKVGGEGMKVFYDKILPKEIGNYVKKWGGQVVRGAIEDPSGDIDMEKSERTGTLAPADIPIHRVDITPEMRESVKSIGQPQFMPARRLNSLSKIYKETLSDPPETTGSFEKNRRGPLKYRDSWRVGKWAADLFSNMSPELSRRLEPYTKSSLYGDGVMLYRISNHAPTREVFGKQSIGETFSLDRGVSSFTANDLSTSEGINSFKEKLWGDSKQPATVFAVMAKEGMPAEDAASALNPDNWADQDLIEDAQKYLEDEQEVLLSGQFKVLDVKELNGDRLVLLEQLPANTKTKNLATQFSPDTLSPKDLDLIDDFVQGGSDFFDQASKRRLQVFANQDLETPTTLYRISYQQKLADGIEPGAIVDISQKHGVASFTENDLINNYGARERLINAITLEGDLIADDDNPMIYRVNSAERGLKVPYDQLDEYTREAWGNQKEYLLTGKFVVDSISDRLGNTIVELTQAPRDAVATAQVHFNPDQDFKPTQQSSLPQFMPARRLKFNPEREAFETAASKTINPTGEERFEQRLGIVGEEGGQYDRPVWVLKGAPPPPPKRDTPAWFEWRDEYLHSYGSKPATRMTSRERREQILADKSGSKFVKELQKEYAQSEADKEITAARVERAARLGFEPRKQDEDSHEFGKRIKAAKSEPNGVFNRNSSNYAAYLDHKGRAYTPIESAIEDWVSTSATAPRWSIDLLLDSLGPEEAEKYVKSLAEEGVPPGLRVLLSYNWLQDSESMVISDEEIATDFYKALRSLMSTELGEQLRSAFDREFSVDAKMENLVRIQATEGMPYEEYRDAAAMLYEELDSIHQEIKKLSDVASSVADLKKAEAERRLGIVGSAREINALREEAVRTLPKKPMTVYRGMVVETHQDARKYRRRQKDNLANKIRAAFESQGYYDLPMQPLSSWTTRESLASVFARHGQGKKDYTATGESIVVSQPVTADNVIMHPEQPSYKSLFAEKKAVGEGFNSGGTDQKEVILKSPATIRLTPDNTKFIQFIPDSGDGRFVEDRSIGVARDEGSANQTPPVQRDTRDSQANNDFLSEFDNIDSQYENQPNAQKVTRIELADLLAITRAARDASRNSIAESWRTTARAEHEALVKALREAGHVIDVTALGNRLQSFSMEHDVYMNPPGFSGRVVKVVSDALQGDYGFEPNSADPTATRYLERIALSNEFLGDDVRVEGILEDGRLVISQPFVESMVDKHGQPVAATQEEIDALLEDGLGFTRIEGAMFETPHFLKQVGNRLITVRDASPNNVVKTPGGMIKPIDFMISEKEVFPDRSGVAQMMPDDFDAEFRLRLDGLLKYANDPNTPGDYQITLKTTPIGQGMGPEEARRITFVVKQAESREDAIQRAEKSRQYRALQMQNKQRPEIESATLVPETLDLDGPDVG